MAYFIDENTIEEIKNRADIVTEISNYVDIKKIGANYKGLCPFHSEKTPSFTVSPQKQIYKCFGCGEGGNVINFIMKIEGLSFPEACKKLGDSYGVVIENKGRLDDARVEKLDMMYQINRELALFYMKNLSDSKNAMSYLIKRNINSKIAKKFGIGYGKNSWDDAVNYLKKLNYDLDLAFQCGAIGKNQSGNYYDYYRDRIIFPIIDARSRILGFGARALGDEMPKYLNTSDSPIFFKGKNLYGLNLLKRNEKIKRIILVEGYMDVIALESFGIKGGVASLGTAFTIDQANILRKYTDDLYISYDGDEAGIAATKRALEIVHSIDWDANIIELRGGMDPDTFLQEEGKLKYEVEIKNSISGYNYLIKDYQKTLDLTRIDDQANLIRYIGNIIRKIKSPIQRELQLKQLSNNFDISIESLKNEIYGNKIQNTNERQRTRNTRIKIKPLTTNDKIFLEIFRLVLHDKEIYRLIENRINPLEIESMQLREVFLSIASSMEEDKINKDSLLKYLKDNYIIDQEIYDELNKKTQEFDKINTKNLLEELISRIEFTDDKLNRNQIIVRIQELEENKNKTPQEIEELKELLANLMKVSKG
ncbi:MAG: DNA primase [Tissierellia bacterium]|nr:DNA primase [Tissierellia bacterium]